jgi:hypothetical protein
MPATLTDDHHRHRQSADDHRPHPPDHPPQQRQADDDGQRNENRAVAPQRAQFLDRLRHGSGGGRLVGVEFFGADRGVERDRMSRRARLSFSTLGRTTSATALPSFETMRRAPASSSTRAFHSAGVRASRSSGSTSSATAKPSSVASICSTVVSVSTRSTEGCASSFLATRSSAPEERRTEQRVALEQRDQRLVAGELAEQRLTQLDDGRVRRGIDVPGIVEVDLEQERQRSQQQAEQDRERQPRRQHAAAVDPGG